LAFAVGERRLSSFFPPQPVKEAKFRVIIPKPVVRELDGLEKKVIERIYGGLRRLGYTPFPGRIKGLKKLNVEKPTYRLRVGYYRIIYRVQRQNVVLLTVVSRKDLEKELKKLR